MKKFVPLALVLLNVLPVAHAAVLEDQLASNNATVQPAGPRSGGSGKNFFNIEGSSNGTFASYGVMDFTLTGVVLGPNEVIASVNSITLTLTQDNSGFSESGPLSFYLTENTSVDIEPGTSPLFFTGSDGAASFGSQLDPNYFLGSGNYVETSDGTQEVFVLNIPLAANSYAVDLLANGGTLRLIATPDSATTAATYTGFSNSTYAGPTVDIDYTVATIPEPAALTLLGLGGLVWVAFGRRRRIG